MTTTVSMAPRLGWRTPAVILLCGCLIGMLGFGARSGLGFFLTPMSQANGWGRDVFSLALAIQMLLWGAAQPFAGAFADRFGPVRVLSLGAVLYALGLASMAYATTPGLLHLTAGVIIGFGLAGRLVHDRDRRVRQADAAILAQLRVRRRHGGGLVRAVPVFAACGRADRPVRLAAHAGDLRCLRPAHHPAVARARDAARQPRAAARRVKQSVKQALSEAFGHRSYMLLVLGFFTCGFQIFFITVHLPAYPGRPRAARRGRRLDAWRRSGCSTSSARSPPGWLSNRHAQALHPRRSSISAARSRSWSTSCCRSPRVSTLLVFGAVLGLLWLSTVPPTSGLVAVMFGTRWLAMLFGFAFFSHQVGGFLGVWLGGILFERTGSYDAVWWLSILFGVLSAVINLPIVEKPVARPIAVPA